MTSVLIVQASSDGGETVHHSKDDTERLPSKGDVLEFEMDEPDAPGGVEWLAGTVLKVDVKKKSFKVVIKNKEDDKSTWNEENYSVTAHLFLFYTCLHAPFLV